MDRLTDYDLSEADYSVARSIIEAQFNIRLRRKTNPEKIEFEHTCNKEVAEQIAMDHLMESKNYYELLEEMENKPESQDQQKTVEVKVIKEKINYNDPDFLEITGV